MDYEEAIKTIKIAKAEVEWNYPMSYQEAFDIAVGCIEKCMPKKPTIIGDGENLCAHCECGQHLDWTYPGSSGMWRNGKTHKFCLNCGQKIDWKVE